VSDLRPLFALSESAVVQAGAGTGKTRTLVARAAWLHGSQGVPASRILLLTFTRRAASDMLARAAAWFDGSSGRICGGTFHAIAHKIIRQHAESFSLPPQFTILDQGDATDLLDVLRPDHGLDGTGQRAPRAAHLAQRRAGRRLHHHDVADGRAHVVHELVVVGRGRIPQPDADQPLVARFLDHSSY